MATFVAQNAANAFQCALNYLAQLFEPLAPAALRSNLPEIVSQQVFCNAPTEVPLFRLFFTNSQNRAQGVRLTPHVVNVSANLFCDWDYQRFAAETNGQPDRVGHLCATIAACHGQLGIISGNATHHLAALSNPAAYPRNQWVRLAQTMTCAARQFAAFAQIHGHNDAAVRLAWCNGINLPNIALANLTVNDLWNATDLLVQVPHIGRQLALNFLKDSGLEHCVKPDVHVRRVGARAFRENQHDPYPNSHDGERASASACIALAQAIASAPGAPVPNISVAAVDRLLWLTGSGRLYFHTRQHSDLPPIRLPRNQQNARITAVARILRAAVDGGNFDL